MLLLVATAVVPEGALKFPVASLCVITPGEGVLGEVSTDIRVCEGGENG